ncbi:hypothetical protein ACIBEJ_47045 [Nonomuraea sp. NPDC050790]|uniref:hypothetical protein n=1 Tax=Nonomuraea sp. NPDC050790 TaxID=3364371 RepID=UPI0037BB3340
MALKTRVLPLAAAGALAASLLTVGGVATASTSSAAEVHACVHKKTRYARIVNPTTPCRKTEVRVLIGGGGHSTSGVQGPQGDRGPAGPAGPTGATGPMGPKGATGPQGPKGLDGKPGENGAPGKDGATGPKGADGKDGLNGKDGATGPKGADGKDGLNGKDGATGPKGADGKNGLNGKDGKDGERGPAGPAGPKGEKGEKGEPGTGGGNYTTYTEHSSIGYTSGTASCKGNDMATGGGFSGISARYTVTGSMPSGAKSWTVTITKDNNNDRSVAEANSHGADNGTVYVVCLKKA